MHGKARQCYLEWKASGRSRSDRTHAEMRVSRLQVYAYTLSSERNNDESRCLSKCIEKLKFYCILEGCPKDDQQQLTFL